MPRPGPPERGPDRSLPLAALGFAHAALALAGALIALQPAGLLALPFLPRAATAVHAVSLGWVTATILGALYLVGPMAFRLPMPVRTVDRVGLALFAGGVTGLLAALAGSRTEAAPIAAALVALGLAPAAARFGRGLARAPVARAAKTLVSLSFVNLAGALVAGAWLGATLAGRASGDPVRLLTAHLVLALGGWVAMLAIGVGLRLIPMLLPSAMPDSARGVVAAWLLEAGLVALALGAPGSAARASGAALLAAGAGLVLTEVVTMLTTPRPRARGLPRPDWGLLLTAAALAALGLAVAAGVRWSLGAVDPLAARMAGRLAVLGGLLFPALLILGVGLRLLPLYAWLRAASLWGVPDGSHPPHRWAARLWPMATAAAGGAGAALVLIGVVADSAGVLRAAGLCWLAAAAGSAGHHARVVSRARREFTTLD